MSDWIDAEGYRANVGIVLMRDNGEVFLGQRTGGRGWQFPQGGVRQGEPVEQALYRELQEEIGLTREQVTLAASTSDWLRYRLPKRYVRRGPRARSASGRSSAGSCCDWRCRNPARVRFQAHQRTGIRRLALGKLLGTGARGDLLQAAGVRAHADRAARRSPFPAARRRMPDWWQSELAAAAEA